MKGSIKEKYLLFLGLFFLVVLLVLLILSFTRRGVYENNFGLNVAVVGEQGVSLLLLRPSEEMVSWVDIPNEAKIKIHDSSASYPITSLWSYGVGERKPYEIVEKSLGQAMSVVIARTIKLDRGGQVEDVLRELISLGTKTDLSIRDRFLIRVFLTESVKSKKMLEYSLPDNVFDKVVEPDGKEFWTFNNAMPLWSKNKFVWESLLDENAEVSINNVSSTQGMGTTLSRQLESSGIHVVEVKADTEDPSIYPGCVYASTKEYTATEEFLKKQVGCRKVSVNSDSNGLERIRIWIK